MSEQPFTPLTPPGSGQQALPPLTLYLHLPWCGRKCPYCDFNSHNAPRQLPEQDYLDALINDMNNALPAVWGRPLRAIFIGGGTPSLFSAAAIDRLLAHARAVFNFPPDIEITIEANPDSSDVNRFSGYRRAGVNRLSLGVQSFSDDSLQQIGRLHNAAAAKHAAAAAALAFDNFNIDLMHALPGQDRTAAVEDVRIAATYNPTHLSLYQLTIESGTPFALQPPPLPEPDTIADISDAVEAEAQRRGYARYEISAYAAAAAHTCYHNLNYWQFGDYLGIGAGAHSKITLPAPAAGSAPVVTREQRVKNPRDYMHRLATGSSPISEQRTLGRDDIVFEFMLNALRLTDGFPAALLTAHTGGGTPHLRRALAEAEKLGLLAHHASHLCPTERGLRHLNTLTALFLPPEKHPSQAKMH